MSVVVILIAVARTWLLPQPEYWWLIAIPWLWFIATTAYLRYVVECPKCLNSFGNDVFGIAFPALAIVPKNFCPACGKSVDERL